MNFMDEMDKVASGMVFSARKLFSKTPPTVLNVGDVGKRVSFDKTSDMIDRLQDNPFFEEATPENRYGMWQGRNIIGRDVPINGGVYLGGGAREAIVVDDKKQSRLGNIYQKLINNIDNVGGNNEEEILEAVFETVRDSLPYDANGVKEIYRKLGSIPDQKISLNSYLKRRVGVCRHQALLCGYLLERLIKDNRILGKVSADRNFVEGLGGHAWARYTTVQGKVYILDVAQNYKGYLEDMTQKQSRWFYERPEDKSLK